jgi:hypothetical protein
MDETMLNTVYDQALQVAGNDLRVSSNRQSLSLSLSLLVIDSAKTAKAWNQQLTAVLGTQDTLQPGTILFLMDFQYVSQQVKQVYGCLRPYLLPVYISWNKEHWAFVVTQPVSLLTNQHQRHQQHQHCYKDVLGDSLPDALDRMEGHLIADLNFVSHGLQTLQNSLIRSKGGDDSDPLKQPREELKYQMIRNIRDKPEHWSVLAKLEENT